MTQLYKGPPIVKPLSCGFGLGINIAHEQCDVMFVVNTWMKSKKQEIGNWENNLVSLKIFQKS